MALLNEFWDLVVPVLLRWGGHANKFIGDGVLGVFGAPDDLVDQLACQLSIADITLHEMVAIGILDLGEVR